MKFELDQERRVREAEQRAEAARSGEAALLEDNAALLEQAACFEARALEAEALLHELGPAPTNPAVIEMVGRALMVGGFDGLVGDGCRCAIADLAPCGEIRGDCQAGWRVDCQSPAWCITTDVHRWATTWTCVACGRVHPIDHEGVLDAAAGEMRCCGCQ